MEGINGRRSRSFKHSEYFKLHTSETKIRRAIMQRFYLKQQDRLQKMTWQLMKCRYTFSPRSLQWGLVFVSVSISADLWRDNEVVKMPASTSTPLSKEPNMTNCPEQQTGALECIALVQEVRGQRHYYKTCWDSKCSEGVKSPPKYWDWSAALQITSYIEGH